MFAIDCFANIAKLYKKISAVTCHGCMTHPCHVIQIQQKMSSNITPFFGICRQTHFVMS